jgi:hypothetical protein
MGLAGPEECQALFISNSDLVQWSPTGKPVVPKNDTLLRPWALERFGAQAPRLRRVIRQ